ncbi:hypothetical protein B0T10DRAFT_530470 [Thelonectria olida]|uniref:Uncharacterized protein n=1 Tax=Thelonectria olida TaxID=1576542 RepID=A0A9P8VZL9_9HYPO|nr:hypothetical protein B0T10DRAFT_530470 [Thelonectria olida]
MALEQTITIVNNSGKIIKTGKQLFSIFKEAQGNYKDKKNEIKAERNLSRSQTFDQSRAIPEPPKQSNDPYQYYYEYDRGRPPRTARPYDTGSDRGSHRSRRSRNTRDFDVRSQHALTEANMKTLSQVSGAPPSRPPPAQRAYTHGYAESIPMDLAMSRGMPPHEMRSQRAMSVRDPGIMVNRSMSATDLVERRKPHKEIDMDLAYGSIPPDLEFRTDLDPKNSDEREATSLIHRVEGLLDEAKCMHHSATTTMTNLQKDPDKAAAVALSLAELSNLVKKTSPAFLTLMKSASPAVFHLLASPHFLIGSSIAVGVTVVCFGGWKIVKRVKEQQAAREALAYESVPMDRPAPMRTQSEYNRGMEYNGVDEALIIDDDLSSIDTWRRGIVPFGEDESADMELITPMADRVTKEMYDKDDFDTKSRRSTRTSRTHDSHRSHRTERSDRTHRSHRSRDERDRDSDRRSRRAESDAGSERSSRSDRTHRSKRKDKVEMKAIEDGRSRRGDDDTQLVLRPKSHRQSSNMLKALFKPKKEMVFA